MQDGGGGSGLDPLFAPKIECISSKIDFYGTRQMSTVHMFDGVKFRGKGLLTIRFT